MVHRLFISLAGVGLLGACSTQPPNRHSHALDPAMPDAAETPLPPSSPTLALNPSAHMGKLQPTDMSHAGHDMGGMHDVPATQPAENAAPSTRSTPATFPATAQALAMNVCPMHPEITSDQPGKCPLCGMALVKKGDQK